MADENGLGALRESIKQVHDSIEKLRLDRDRPWPIVEAPVDGTGWNFRTYSTHISQRFSDLSLQLQQRFEAQQAGVTTAMIAAEKAVNSALTAAEKAVDKAEQAQALRNEAQNEFRKSLSDLSSMMWMTKDGIATVDSLRRELVARISNVEEKVHASARERLNQLESLRREQTAHAELIDDKVNVLNVNASNMQGRFAMLGVIWGVVVVIASAAIKYFH